MEGEISPPCFAASLHPHGSPGGSRLPALRRRDGRWRWEHDGGVGLTRSGLEQEVDQAMPLSTLAYAQPNQGPKLLERPSYALLLPRLRLDVCSGDPRRSSSRSGGPWCHYRHPWQEKRGLQRRPDPSDPRAAVRPPSRSVPASSPPSSLTVMYTHDEATWKLRWRNDIFACFCTC